MRRAGSRDATVTSRIMASIHGKDGRAERLFRKALYGRGVRFRKHYKRLLGTPDVAIPWARIAVFIDGDFWHGNSWRLRGLPNLASLFPTRTAYWVAKITRNMERDKKYTAELQRQGWVVLRFWESEVLQDVDKIVDRVIRARDKVRAG